jgi:hypothetical protein
MTAATMKQDFLTRVQSGVRKRSMFGQMSTWMQENVILNGEPFSFKDHEFQIQIADETRSMVCKKVAQVGLSQISVQKAIGYTALTRGKHLIYVLPSAVFAVGFSKSRVDPVIAESPKIRSKVNSGVDSAKLKQIGTSFLHFGGASNMNQVISVPAEAIVTDEYNFCDPTVVTAYESRLGHAENGGINSRFSTPTLPDFGVSKEIKQTTWARYLVKCPHCYAEVAPIFSEHVRIPGFDRPFSEFDSDVLEQYQSEIGYAFIACPSCGGSLDQALGDASKRRWVEQYPGRDVAGYDVRPFDLFKYNPTSAVLKKITKYKLRQDYYNFALGEDYLSAESQIILANVEANMVVGAEDTSAYEMQMGVDVGKTCHYMIGTKINNQIVIRKVGRLYLADGDLKEQILGVAREHGVTNGVIDGGPDANLSRGVFTDFDGEGAFYPAYYSESGDKNFNYWTLNEKENFLLLNRTKACQTWVDRVNMGRVLWPRSQPEEMQAVMTQLQNMKRMKDMEAENPDDSSFRWVKAAGNDHYFHAGLYLMAAIDHSSTNQGKKLLYAPTGVCGVAIGAKHEADSGNVTARLFQRAFGLR